MLNFQNCQLVEHGVRGFWMFTLFLENHMPPVGFVWGISYVVADERRVFHVQGSCVPCEYKRKGVRTQINRMLEEKFDVLITSGGSTEGRAFMAANGYRVEPSTGFWVKQIRKPKNVRSKRRK